MRVAPLLAAVSIAACTELPMAPPAPSFSSVPQGTTAVFHFTAQDGGKYSRLVVASTAVASHQGHGDGIGRWGL